MNERRENTLFFLKHLTSSGFLFSRFINVMCQVSIFWHCWFTRRFLNIKIINHFRPPFGPFFGLQTYWTYFGRGSPKEHLDKVWLKIDKMVLEICVILKKTSGRGWGRPRASTLEAFNLSIHPDHKYIWFRGWDLNHYKVHFR